MKKLLITGASGFLGWHLAQELSPHFDIQGVYYRQHFEAEAINWHRFNLLETDKIKDFVASTGAELLLHAAAMANPNFCQENPALSHHVNVYATVGLAEACKTLNIPMLFISTDMVFNGNGGPYSEMDFPYPISTYGSQKLAAEELILEDFTHTAVCRLPLLFGQGPSYRRNFLIQWLEKMSDEETVSAFKDEYRSPLSGTEAAKGLLAILHYLEQHQWQAERLWHLPGPERISRYDLALLIAKVFGFPATSIEASLRSEVPMAAPRPEDVSLESIHLSKLSHFHPASLEEQLTAIYTEFLKKS